MNTPIIIYINHLVTDEETGQLMGVTRDGSPFYHVDKSNQHLEFRWAKDQRIISIESILWELLKKTKEKIGSQTPGNTTF